MSTSGREAGSAPLGMKAMLYLETTQRQMARKGTFSKAPVPDRFTRRVERVERTRRGAGGSDGGMRRGERRDEAMRENRWDRGEGLR